MKFSNVAGTNLGCSSMLEWRYNETFVLFCGRWQLKNWREFPNIVFTDLFTHYSLRLSNRVQREQVKITGKDFTTDTSQLPKTTE